MSVRLSGSLGWTRPLEPTIAKDQTRGWRALAEERIRRSGRPLTSPQVRSRHVLRGWDSQQLPLSGVVGPAVPGAVSRWSSSEAASSNTGPQNYLRAVPAAWLASH